MSTLTKQWLQQKIADMEATRDEIPFGLDEDDSNTLAALRIALASLEAEAVAWLLSGGGAKNNVSFDSGNAYADPLREVTPLYTAPPAQVSVPAAMEMDDDFDSAFEHGKAVGWNACRAAMLQAGNSPVTPDGYVLVPKKLTAENGAKSVLSGEFSETKFINCPECFGDDDCETCDGSGRIEITVPVTWTTIKAIWAKGVEHFAAAPQQEVKSALEHGMQRYAGAMQRLAEGDK